MENYPAVSAEWAMQECPNARNAERAKLIELAALNAGATVVDLQAAGGYLATGIDEALEGDVDLICLEPCRALNSRLPAHYHLVEDPIESWVSLADNSVDVVMGLAGLHHSNNQQATIDEAFRVLRPGGRIVICDVEVDSAIANWLNVYVDKHNAVGHKGNFLSRNQLSCMLNQAGFKFVSECLEYVPWNFESEYMAARFFKGLFGLESVAEQDVLKAMKNFLTLKPSVLGVAVDWHLIYGSAIK